MANSRSGGNTSSHNYNLIKNNKNTIENSKGKLNLLSQAKLDLLDSMNFENTLVNRNNLANQIADNREKNGLNGKNIGVPGGDIIIRKSPDISVNIDLDTYGMKGDYENLINEINNLKINGGNLTEIAIREKKLRELDSILAERCILDAGASIEFKSTDVFESERNAKDESKKAFDELNKLDAYKGKIELISKQKAGVDFYVIKWTEEQIKEIKQKYEELLKKNEEIQDDEIQNEEIQDDEKKDDEKENNEKKKEENEKNKEMEALIKKLMEDSEKKDKKIEEQNARITNLENLLKNKDEESDEEFKNTDSDDEITDEEDNKNDDKLENTETLDENSNYISRSFVEGLLYGIRGSEGYPKGTIKIREEIINIEEFEFYEEFKQEYIEAKGDATRLSILDKEFAEMIILFSPKGADYENKYCIKLSESELKDGLYVSDERLARYGVSIKVSEYFEKIVEKEVIRERKIIRNIETVITELQTSIVELTRTISIERSSSKVILEEIKRKRELLLILIKKQRKLLLSLKGVDNNDEELRKLREEESKLQKEYDDLLKEKEKQNKLKNDIEEIKNKIKELESKNKPSKLKDKINKKKKEAEEIKNDIENLKKERDEYQWRLDNGTISADEIVTLKSNIEKLNKKIEKLESDLKKLENEIKELENGKDNADITKLEKEIEKEKSEREEMIRELSELVAQKSLYETGRENNETDADNEKRNAKIKELEDKIKEKNAKIKELENKLKSMKEEGDESDELKALRKKLAELEGQLDPNIDKKLESKKQELENIRKQIKEKEQSGDKGELEAQLLIIIEEQEALLAELESLESLLIIAKTKEEKIKIEERIRIINKRLTIISQKITEFESFIQIYKSKITVKKYTVYQIVPLQIPVPVQGLQLNSVISDMGTDVFREKAALKVEEELKRQYKSLGRWQIGSRLALFLGRGRKRKKMMQNEINSMANTAFQTGANYATLNEQSQNAADRHAHELLTSMDAVNRITTVRNPQVDQLCKDFLNGIENDASFQPKFNAIVAADPNITAALRGQNITHIGTNILLQLKEQLAINRLIHRLDGQLSQYIATGNAVYMQNMQNYVEQYIRDYQKNPAFMSTFEQFVNGNLNAKNRLRAYLSHQKAIMNMQITNLRMNIDILNNGKSAYQIDNKDREKGWKYKLGHFMDKHPRGTAIGSAALAVGLGVATAPMSAVAGAAVTTGVFGSYVGFTNYVKKWTHHTKEQNTHEKNVVTDYRNEQKKIQQWQNDALNGHGRKKYKAKRQLALYDQTTQENIKLSNQITEYITNLSAKSESLTNDEENFMELNLIEGWARLKYYREMGHNFLASENVNETEKDMRRLEKAITLGLQKIGKTTNDIETTMSATNGLGTNVTYSLIQNDLKASYNKSLIQFKRERKNLALKYGVARAATSIGFSLGLQYFTGSGVFAKDVPATQGIPASGGETTSYASGTDTFTLGGDNLNNGSVYNTAKSAISSGAPKGSDLTFTYGVGTDGTRVIGTFNPAGKFSALNTDFANTSLYPNLSSGQVTSLQNELSKIMSDPTFISAFKDSDLAKMRAMESLEHFARALNDSGRPDLILHFNHNGSIPGLTPKTVTERFMKGAIDITTPKVAGTPGTPGIPAETWGRWLMGLPLFFFANTYKSRKSSKDTTDQNFGSNAQGNQQQQPRNP